VDHHVAGGGVGDPVVGEMPQEMGLPIALPSEDQRMSPLGGQPLDLPQLLLPAEGSSIINLPGEGSLIVLMSHGRVDPLFGLGEEPRPEAIEKTLIGCLMFHG